jgi:hypothetical protein
MRHNFYLHLARPLVNRFPLARAHEELPSMRDVALNSNSVSTGRKVHLPKFISFASITLHYYSKWDHKGRGIGLNLSRQNPSRLGLTSLSTLSISHVVERTDLKTVFSKTETSAHDVKISCRRKLPAALHTQVLSVNPAASPAVLGRCFGIMTDRPRKVCFPLKPPVKRLEHHQPLQYWYRIMKGVWFS